jgi:cobalamin biosynthesis Mg chelatase CobN
MKKITMFCLAICFTFSLNLMAQQGQMPSPQEQADREMERLTTELKLSNELKSKIAPLVLKYAEQRKEIIELEMPKRNLQGLRTKMEALNSAKSSEIKPLLTKSQKKKYDKVQRKMQDEMRSALRSRMGGGMMQGGN